MATEKKYKKITPDSEQERRLEPSEPNGFPNIYLESDDIAEVEDWEVGQVYEVALKIKMRSKSDRTVNGGETETNGNFDVVAYKILKEPKELEDMDAGELKEYIGENGKQ